MIIIDQNLDFLKATKCPETYVNAAESDLVIWVDPLDGTGEYTQGFLERVTVLIGISVNDRAVGGVIHQPYFESQTGELGRTIWGIKDKFTVTTTRSHSNAIVQAALEALKPDEVLKVGGAGFKVLQLIEGNAHAYVFASAGCKKWDTCAPEAVLEAYGGSLTDILGRHYLYGKNVKFPNTAGILGTARGINHQEIIDKLPDSVKVAMRDM